MSTPEANDLSALAAAVDDIFTDVADEDNPLPEFTEEGFLSYPDSKDAWARLFYMAGSYLQTSGEGIAMFSVKSRMDSVAQWELSLGNGPRDLEDDPPVVVTPLEGNEDAASPTEYTMGVTTDDPTLILAMLGDITNHPSPDLLCVAVSRSGTQLASISPGSVMAPEVFDINDSDDYPEWVAESKPVQWLFRKFMASAAPVVGLSLVPVDSPYRTVLSHALDNASDSVSAHMFTGATLEARQLEALTVAVAGFRAAVVHYCYSLLKHQNCQAIHLMELLKKWNAHVVMDERTGLLTSTNVALFNQDLVGSFTAKAVKMLQSMTWDDVATPDVALAFHQELPLVEWFSKGPFLVNMELSPDAQDHIHTTLNAHLQNQLEAFKKSVYKTGFTSAELTKW